VQKSHGETHNSFNEDIDDIFNHTIDNGIDMSFEWGFKKRADSLSPKAFKGDLNIPFTHSEEIHQNSKTNNEKFHSGLRG
jgi:hypothetical protein